MNKQEDNLSTSQQEVGLSTENEYIETPKEKGFPQQWRPPRKCQNLPNIV